MRAFFSFMLFHQIRAFHFFLYVIGL